MPAASIFGGDGTTSWSAAPGPTSSSVGAGNDIVS